MKQQKRNIAILCGGDSSEHDVSLRSAQGIYSFFDKERYNVYVVDVKGTDWHVDLSDGTTARIDLNTFSFMQGRQVVMFDYAYITIHGTPGENGLMQGYFDMMGVPYSTSGVLVEALTFNKFILNQYLRGFGVSVADSMLIRKGYEKLVSDDEIEERIGMPCFVKPTDDGSSFGVTKVKNKSQLAPAIKNAFKQFNQVLLIAFLYSAAFIAALALRLAPQHMANQFFCLFVLPICGLLRLTTYLIEIANSVRYPAILSKL